MKRTVAAPTMKDELSSARKKRTLSDETTSSTNEARIATPKIMLYSVRVCNKANAARRSPAANVSTRYTAAEIEVSA